MKYKKLVLFFGMALPANILLRTLQLCFTIDLETGFFNNEYNSVGFILLVLIFSICAVCAGLCFTGHRNPEHPPKNALLLSLASLFAIGSIGIETVSDSFSEAVMPWQSTILSITGLLAIIYFLAFTVCGLAKLKLPPITAAAPVLYYVMRIICTFTSISSLALISDNLLLLATYCTLLIFFLCYGKLYNGLDSEKNFRKLMASGFTSIILCFTQSIPYFIINIVSESGYTHTSPAVNASLFMIGIFTAVFIFSHFSLKNTAVTYTKRPETPENQRFYFNP